jgi:hypothetical protein
MEMPEAIAHLAQFRGDSLTRTINTLEVSIKGSQAPLVTSINEQFGINQQLISAALLIKQMSAQIDVIVHSSLIMYCLPRILNTNETVKSVSLGADNAGSQFDLVTDQRIAEFKFILWQRKGNAIRNKTLFRDFYKLASAPIQIEKNIFLLSTEKPLKFLNGRRKIDKVLDDADLIQDFINKQDREYENVGDYYRSHREVKIQNLTEKVPELKALVPAV